MIAVPIQVFRRPTVLPHVEMPDDTIDDTERDQNDVVTEEDDEESEEPVSFVDEGSEPLKEEHDQSLIFHTVMIPQFKTNCKF